MKHPTKNIGKEAAGQYTAMNLCFSCGDTILLRTRWTIKPVGSDGWSFLQ